MIDRVWRFTHLLICLQSGLATGRLQEMPFIVLLGVVKSLTNELSMAASTEELLEDWYRRLRYAQYAHYEAAKAFDCMNYWLGIPVVVLSTFVGTSVFASLGKLVDATVQISIGLISVLAATLASLQTFLRFSERAEKHRVAASKYGALRREIEELLATGGPIPPEAITPLRLGIDRLAEDAPHVPNRIWSKRQTVLEEDRANLVGLLRDS